jgi:sigma-B regulation protein RsbU (phosphoserine phosphatase)
VDAVAGIEVAATRCVMDVQDLSQNHRIASLFKLMRELAHSRTPEQTLRMLHRGFAEAYGFTASVLLATRGLPQGQYRVLQMRLQRGPLDDVPDQARLESAPVQSGGVMAAIIGRSEPQLIQEVDWSSDSFFHETLSGYWSVMAVPFAGDHLPITWVILLKRSPERFAIQDLEETVERVALIGSLLENQALVGQLKLAHERIDRDARHVGELQRALLPAVLPQIAGLEIAVSYEPSGRAGGDLYDFFPLDERHNDHVGADPAPTRWCVFIGDATGHGLAAAVVMAIVQSVLHAHPVGIARSASLLAHVNRQLCRKHMDGLFTAFLGIYEPISRRLTYANAGHPRPLLRRSSDGSVCPLDAVATFPLGIDESETFKEATVQLESGDTLLLYTDGITEARGAEGDLFEQDRLTRVFRDGGDRPAELIERLRKAVRAHEQGQNPSDDQTLVAARIL